MIGDHDTIVPGLFVEPGDLSAGEVPAGAYFGRVHVCVVEKTSDGRWCCHGRGVYPNTGVAARDREAMGARQLTNVTE